MKRIMVTGSAGFLAGNLIPVLKAQGCEVIGVDKTQSMNTDLKLNLVEREKCFALIAAYKPNIIVHLAAQIDFNERATGRLYSNNVTATRNLKDAAIEADVSQIIFTSSCSIFAGSKDEQFGYSSVPKPIDEYGMAKVEEEDYLLEKSSGSIAVSILRTPMIVGSGRLGMLSILFELMERGNAIWVLGDGGVRHQLVYVNDVCAAIVGLLGRHESATYHVGSKDVPTFKEMYDQLIQSIGSRSKIRSIPMKPAIWALNIARVLKISPLGGYQLRMLTTNFSFDYQSITEDIGWYPTKTNAEMMCEAYQSYRENAQNFQSDGEIKSKNRIGANFGVLKLLKYVY